MTALHELLDLQTTIFLLMAVGYILTKIGVLPPAARKPLTDLVIDFILPCNILVSFLLEFNRQILLDCLAVFLVSVGIQILTYMLGRLLYRRAASDEKPVLQYGTFVSNAGFLGTPIAEGLYGAQGLLYASIYLVPMRIMMWSAGVACFEGVKGKDVVKKTVTHPCILAAVIGLFLMLTQLPLPSGLEKALRTASSCNTALSMLVIGNILAEIDPRKVVSRKSLAYCALRLLLIPLGVLLICRLCRVEGLAASVAVVLAGMPTPATTAMLAARYGKAEHLAVSLVFLSTILSLVTVPALAMLVTVV